MKTTASTAAKPQTQTIQLVKGEFSPSEALHIVLTLLNEKINFHKKQKLQVWEGNHQSKTLQLDARIDELEQEKERARHFLNSETFVNQNFTIDGVLNISHVG